MADRIVSIGLLSQRDLNVLGAGFTRHFAIDDDDIFDELLKRLDDATCETTGREQDGGS